MKVRSKQGEGYIETVVIVLVSMMMIVLLLNVFSLIIEEQKLSYFSRELLVYASAYGGMVEETNRRFSELCDEVGITPELDSEGTKFFNEASGKVQLGEKIIINLSYETKLLGFGVLNIPITITRSGSAISEKYWK